MYQSLPASYKGKYPFKIGTTSFIYPDHMAPNVKMLAPFLDEIELLFFESSFDSIPSESEIIELHKLSEEYGITYNVHLPTDIFPGSGNSSETLRFIETVQYIISLTSILSPSTYTLHLAYREGITKNVCCNAWLNSARRSIERLLATGIKSEAISIETLDYPFEWIDSIISDFNLSVCVDTGHLMLNGFDIESVFTKYLKRTSIIHLHGIQNSNDHLSLDKLSCEEIGTLFKFIQGFAGTISIEVFSFDNLSASLQHFGNCYNQYFSRILIKG